MKFLFTTLIFLLFSTFSNAQLSVNPSPFQDNFIYISGTLLFVEQGVNLSKNADASPTEASIYLRRGAQLIQGEGNYQNSGNGLLSVFQEGTSNAYDYNYWSSAVGNEKGLFGISMLHAPLDKTQSIPAKITSALEGKADPLTISSYWIYTYAGTSYSDWSALGDEISIPGGLGFSMKGVNGIDATVVNGVKNNPGNSQRYDFRGRPNSGDIAVEIVQGEQTLLGNPYPSAFDLSLFLIENSGTGTLKTDCYGEIKREPLTTGIAYFWDSVENGTSHYLKDYVGGYGIFSPVDPCTNGIYEQPVFRTYGELSDESGTLGKFYNRRFLPIAQGFMVEGAATSQLIFKNKYRTFVMEGEHSDFKYAVQEKQNISLTTIPKIQLEAVINDVYTRTFTLAFWPTATPEKDNGMDAETREHPPTDIGWFLDDRNYVINVRPYDELEEIPLYLRVEEPEAKIKIRLKEVEALQLENLFIHDSLSGTYSPIIGDELNLNLENGFYNKRYSIAFRKEETPPQKEEDSSEGLQVKHIPFLDLLEVRHNETTGIREIFLYDLSGKILYTNEELSGNFFSLSTSTFANSLYIVKIITEDFQEKSVKVPIFKH